MSEYGLRVSDIYGNSSTLTADDATIISAGEISMPNSLEGDNTYGIDIALPGTVAEADIGVFITPNVPVIYSKFSHAFDGSTEYWACNYADSTKSYYSRNDSTGVMTSWAAGDMRNNDAEYWDTIVSVFPVAFWDKMGETSFTNVRLFAATCYLVVDASLDYVPYHYGRNIIVYGIGTSGVTKVNYLVCVKKHS